MRVFLFFIFVLCLSVRGKENWHLLLNFLYRIFSGVFKHNVQNNLMESIFMEMMRRGEKDDGEAM